MRRREARSAVAVAVVDAHAAADGSDAVAIAQDIDHLLLLAAAFAAADDISASKPNDVDTTFVDYRRETID